MECPIRIGLYIYTDSHLDMSLSFLQPSAPSLHTRAYTAARSATPAPEMPLPKACGHVLIHGPLQNVGYRVRFLFSFIFGFISQCCKVVVSLIHPRIVVLANLPWGSCRAYLDVYLCSIEAVASVESKGCKNR
jgi:hypothetical protein